MDRYTVGRAVGFFVLLLSSLTFLSLLLYVINRNGLPFSAAVGFVLLIYAWSDYRHFIINVTYGLAVLIGFLVADFEGLVYALPLGLTYLVFIYLMRKNRERLAAVLLAVSLPLALASSYLVPPSGLVAWTLVGLMAGIAENAIVEEMAEGDPIMIALYFMALGPLALIPFALQNITGRVLFAKEIGWPVGPAMFTVSVPLFELVFGDASSRLPGWLIYVQNHGVPHGTAGILAGVFVLWSGLGIGIIKTLADEGMNFVEIVAGIMTAAVAFLLALIGVGAAGYYLNSTGHTTASYAVLLAGFVLMAIVAVKAVRLPRFHYEKKSSISWLRWTAGIFLLADGLSIGLLFKVWGTFGNHKLALAMGFLLAVWYYAVFMRDVMADEMQSLRQLPKFMLFGLRVLDSWLFIVSAFIAGLWVGLGMVTG